MPHGDAMDSERTVRMTLLRYQHITRTETVFENISKMNGTPLSERTARAAAAMQPPHHEQTGSRASRALGIDATNGTTLVLFGRDAEVSN